MNELINQQGRYRAARAAKKINTFLSISYLAQYVDWILNNH